jgi:hypothetical protein
MAERQITRNDELSASFKTISLNNPIGRVSDAAVHKRANPRRRLGKRRSSYRQQDSKNTSTASGSNWGERRYVLLLAADEAYEHHCPIDDARAVDRVFLLAQRCVYRAAQSPRYQAAFVFLSLWR